MANINNANIDYIQIEDLGADPTATPTSGFGYIYIKNNNLFIKLDDTTVVGPFGISTTSALDDLSDVDTVTNAPATGSVLVYTGLEWEPFDVGADGTILVADSGQSEGVAWSSSAGGGDAELLALIGL